MSRANPIFQERITPSIGVTVSLLALDIAIAFALWAALGERIALVVLILALVLCAIWWWSAIQRIFVDDEILQVNQARIPLSLLREVEPLDQEAWRVRIGVEYDPRIFHAHRFWIRSGVQITLEDPRDPHPAWLVGTRRFLELADLIRDRKTRA